jgi:hypothetical protein
MPESQSFEALKEQYFTLDTSFNELLAACQDDDQRNLLRRDYVTARSNFLTARNRIFDDNDPMVSSLITEMAESQGKIEAALSGLQDIVTTLQIITAGVRLGSSLVSLAATA